MVRLSSFPITFVGWSSLTAERRTYTCSYYESPFTSFHSCMLCLLRYVCASVLAHFVFSGGDEIRRAEEQAYAIEEQMFRRYVPMHEDPGWLYINQLGSVRTHMSIALLPTKYCLGQQKCRGHGVSIGLLIM